MRKGSHGAIAPCPRRPGLCCSPGPQEPRATIRFATQRPVSPSRARTGMPIPTAGSGRGGRNGDGRYAAVPQHDHPQPGLRASRLVRYRRCGVVAVALGVQTLVWACTAMPRPAHDHGSRVYRARPYGAMAAFIGALQVAGEGVLRGALAGRLAQQAACVDGGD